MKRPIAFGLNVDPNAGDLESAARMPVTSVTSNLVYGPGHRPRVITKAVGDRGGIGTIGRPRPGMLPTWPDTNKGGPSRPGRDRRPDGTVGPAVGHVRREGSRDPQAEQPAGQGGDRDPVPFRVQHNHRTGVKEAVDRGRLQPGRDSALAVCPDDRISMPVGDICCDARHGEHGRRRGQADGAVDAARRIRTVAVGGRGEYGHRPAPVPCPRLSATSRAPPVPSCRIGYPNPCGMLARAAFTTWRRRR
jgi:hypothetical protein